MKAPYLNLSLKSMKCIVKGIVIIEKWRWIYGYKGIYKISNFGRIKAVARDVLISYGAIRKHPLRILRQSEYSQGYLYVQLPIKKKANGRRYKHHKIHILVAKAFIKNPFNKPKVNHKRGDKKDNRAWMLEWNTVKENTIHAFATGLRRPSFGGLFKYQISEDKARQILKLHKEGLSYNKISKLLGVGCPTVSRHIKKHQSKQKS